MKQVLTLLTILSATASGSVVKLEVDTFDKLTAGKTVFIKFFAPWVCMYSTEKVSFTRRHSIFLSDVTLFFVFHTGSVGTVRRWHPIGKSWLKNGRTMQLGWLRKWIVPKKAASLSVKSMVLRVSQHWCMVIQPHPRYETEKCCRKLIEFLYRHISLYTKILNYNIGIWRSTWL